MRSKASDAAVETERQAILPYMSLLGAVIRQLALDIIILRRRGVLDDMGRLTKEGERRFPKNAMHRHRDRNLNKIDGISSRFEIEELGRIVYGGGLERIFERLGLPDCSEQFRADIERQAHQTTRAA
jgi:hypothetical protein